MFFLFWGFIVWLSATLIFRFAGHYFFTPDNVVLMTASYIFVIPLILVITLPVYKWKKIKSDGKLKAAICIALPGMLLDVFALIFFQDIFTNLNLESDKYFGSWLLWAYSLIILTGFDKRVR